MLFFYSKDYIKLNAKVFLLKVGMLSCERAACPTTQDRSVSTSLWKAESTARTEPQHRLVARGTGRHMVKDRGMWCTSQRHCTAELKFVWPQVNAHTLLNIKLKRCPNVQVSELWGEKISLFLFCLLFSSIRCKIILLSCYSVSHSTHLLTFCLFLML